jgi:hypothetical protein
MKTYCTQNDGKCETCSLVNYGRDCRNNQLSKGIDKSGLCGSERDLADMLDECLREGNLPVAIKALQMAGDAFPLRHEYLVALGEMMVSGVAEEPITPAEETISIDSQN